MPADQLGIESLQMIVGKAEFLRNVAAQIADDRVRILDQAVQNLPAAILRQVDGHALLVVIEPLIENARRAFRHVVQEEGADRARNISAIARILDLDDFRAHVDEILGADRPGAILLYGQNADAV